MITWLASYPRSGNTLFRITMKHVFNVDTYSVYNDTFDIGADSATADMVGHKNIPSTSSIHAMRASRTGYFVKTHDHPAPMYREGDRTIYIIRDGRDACVSFQNYLRKFRGMEHDLQDIIEGTVGFGAWGPHFRAWNPVNRPDTLVVRYEDLVRDPESTISSMADFTGLAVSGGSGPTFEELSAINPDFFRKGASHSWKEEFSDAEHLQFWLAHGDVMRTMGYTDDMPAMLSTEQGILAESLSRRINHLNRQVAEATNISREAYRYSFTWKVLERIQRLPLIGRLVDRLPGFRNR